MPIIPGPSTGGAAPSGPAVLEINSSLPRRNMKDATSLVSGQMRLGYFWASRTELVATARTVIGAVPAAATPTLIRYGLYEIDVATLAGTLVASTPNDTSLMAAASTTSTKALSVPYQMVKDVRYAVGVLVVSTATMPQVYGSNSVGGVGSEAGMNPRTSAVLTVADLPASFTNGSLTNSAVLPYMAFAP